MGNNTKNLTGAAGEHYVAYKLSTLGYIAALPRGGTMGVDVLVSNSDGSQTLAIQVKTTNWATRQRGRGDQKQPFQLQFPLGYKSAKIDNPRLLYAFVDLLSNGDGVCPDVYIVPAQFVYNHCEAWVDKVKLVRFHIPIEELAPFKNNWSLIAESFSI